MKAMMMTPSFRAVWALTVLCAFTGILPGCGSVQVDPVEASGQLKVAVDGERTAMVNGQELSLDGQTFEIWDGSRFITLEILSFELTEEGAIATVLMDGVEFEINYLPDEANRTILADVYVGDTFVAAGTIQITRNQEAATSKTLASTTDFSVQMEPRAQALLLVSETIAIAVVAVLLIILGVGAYYATGPYNCTGNFISRLFKDCPNWW